MKEFSKEFDSFFLQVFSMEEKVRTRSQRAGHPERWTQVPVLVKIFKLIIYELSNAIDTNMGKDELNVRFRYFKGDYQLWLVDDR